MATVLRLRKYRSWRPRESLPRKVRTEKWLKMGVRVVWRRKIKKRRRRREKKMC